MKTEQIEKQLEILRSAHPNLVWDHLVITHEHDIYSVNGIFARADFIKMLDSWEVIRGNLPSGNMGYRILEAKGSTESLERTKVGQCLLNYFGFNHDQIPI